MKLTNKIAEVNMTMLMQWATTGPKVREDQSTVEELEAQGWTRCERGDQRYPHVVLMKKEVDQ